MNEYMNEWLVTNIIVVTGKDYVWKLQICSFKDVSVIKKFILFNPEKLEG